MKLFILLSLLIAVVNANENITTGIDCFQCYDIWADCRTSQCDCIYKLTLCEKSLSYYCYNLYKDGLYSKCIQYQCNFCNIFKDEPNSSNQIHLPLLLIFIITTILFLI